MRNFILGLFLGIALTLSGAGVYTTTLLHHARQVADDRVASYVELINKQKETIEKQDEAIEAQNNAIAKAKNVMADVTNVMHTADDTIVRQGTVLGNCMGALRQYADLVKENK